MIKTLLKLFLLSSILIVIIDLNDFNYAQPAKIQIIGENIARGLGSTDVGGFRRPLHIMLTGSDYYVQFVGSQSIGQENDFDRRCDAISNLYAGNDPDTAKNNNLNQMVYDLVRVRKPHVILLYIGFYDLLEGNGIDQTVANVDSVLNEIQRYENDYSLPLKVLLSTLINTSGIQTGDSLSQKITLFNSKLRQLAADRKSNPLLRNDLVLVDMERNAGLDYTIDKKPPYANGDMSSNIYPNDNGYIKMATVWYEALQRILNPYDPPVITLKLPAQRTINTNTTVTFTWDTIPGAANYRLQIAEDSLFKSVVIDSVDTTSKASITARGLSFSTLYYWRLISSGLYSIVRTFSTELKAPSNLTATTLGAHGVLLAWKDSISNELGFIVERKSGGGDFTVIDTVSANTTLFIDSSLTSNTTYVYRVKAFNTLSQSQYTNEVTFILTSVQDVTSLLPKEFGLAQNFPNPFNPATTINYQLPREGYVSLKVYDVLGSEIATLVEGVKPAGYYKIVFNGNRLASGVYFYRLSITDQQKNKGLFTSIKKFILMK